MIQSRIILSLAGDGIGPEIIAQAHRIIDWLNTHAQRRYRIDEALIGGAAIDDGGNPLPAETLALAGQADGILLGAVGGPRFDELPFDRRPERGLLGLRREMGLFANLRPAGSFDALSNASSLKPDVIAGLDIMIVRELTGGIYFGEPRGITQLSDGRRRGVNTLVYDTAEIDRIARVAFELARERDKRLCSIDKANVLEATALWREEVTRIGQADYPDVALSHLYVDNAAMQLVRDPSQFDVIVTTNMFGDILSDITAMLTGSLGMLASASLGAIIDGTRRRGMYEPIHGSAPDIAGKNCANPLAMILSVAMMMRSSLGDGQSADLIERAVRDVLDDGFRTNDIMEDGKRRVSTSQMGDAVLAALDRRSDGGFENRGANRPSSTGTQG